MTLMCNAQIGLRNWWHVFWHHVSAHPINLTIGAFQEVTSTVLHFSQPYLKHICWHPVFHTWRWIHDIYYRLSWLYLNVCDLHQCESYHAIFQRRSCFPCFQFLDWIFIYVHYTSTQFNTKGFHSSGEGEGTSQVSQVWRSPLHVLRAIG